MPSSRRILPHWTPKVATVLTTVLTSLFTSTATVPIALWAIQPPQQIRRLWLAIAACLAAIGLGVALGRTVARAVLGWTERRRPERRQAQRGPGADRRRTAGVPA